MPNNSHYLLYSIHFVHGTLCTLQNIGPTPCVNIAEYSICMTHRCHLVRFSGKSYGFLINWLAYGRTRQSLRIFAIWKMKNSMYFRQLPSAFFKMESPVFTAKSFPQYLALIGSQSALRKHKLRYWACARCVHRIPTCAITNRSTEHVRGTCILSQNAFLSMRRRLTHRNWQLLYV